MSEKTILDEIFDALHNFWYGQPEQKQHEGTSTTDEAGETAEVPKGGGTDETIEERTTDDITPEERTTTDSALPRDRGLERA